MGQIPGIRFASQLAVGQPHSVRRTNLLAENTLLENTPPENWPPTPRGYFAIGAERTSKALNLGNLMRSAHGFGASFTFTIGATYKALEARADTSKGQDHLPHYNWDGLDAMRLPLRCQLVGIELTGDAIDLPSFRHPTRAAYVLGPERGSLSEPLLERCDFVVKIPTKFCVNVAIAGAIVMYDRVAHMSRFADRPVRAGGPTEPVPQHQFGERFQRNPSEDTG
ncbi:MAG: tRNA G18 (ribose-2'-O)-methylase SpoU [Hyphomicrobiaceae bacterium]